MKRAVNDIIGRSVYTIEGTKGKVKDFLFDDRTWIMRYMEVDFGNVFNYDRILIPWRMLKDAEISLNDGDIQLGVSKDTIDMCPRPEDNKPISRKYEEELNAYYRLSGYWTYPHMVPEYGIGDNIIRLKVPDREDEQYDYHLQSFNDIKDYVIRAQDDTLGGPVDLFVDNSSWQILYMVIDTNNWLPWSKKVLLSINQLDNISNERKEIDVSLNTEIIRNAPDYDGSGVLESLYEGNLYNYYEKAYVDVKM